MKMVRAQAILNWQALKHYRELHPSEYIEWDYHSDSLPSIPSICVSHRWVSARHPDPNGAQLRELQQRITSLIQSGEQYVIFYDYCSMPQAPRSTEEEQIFTHDLSSLNSLFHQSSKVIILSEGYADYRDRAWCFLELVISGEKDKIHFFADQDFIRRDLDFAESLSPKDGEDIIAAFARLYPDRFKGVSPIDHRGITNIITSLHMKETYQHIPGVVESIVAVIQHLDACRVTHSEDLVAIRRQMSAYLLGWGQVYPCGSLLIALSKYFKLAYCLIGGETVFECKPYFEQPAWNRLSKEYIFSLPPPQCNQLVEIAKTEQLLPLIRLALPGENDIAALFQRYQEMPDWEQYVVPPNKAILLPSIQDVQFLEHGAILIPGSTKPHTSTRHDSGFTIVDPFPSLAHVVHTVLERTAGFLQLEDRDGINYGYVLLDAYNP